MKNNQDNYRVSLLLEGVDHLLLFGENDQFLRKIRNAFPCQITARGNKLIVSGDRDTVKKVVDLFSNIIGRIERGDILNKPDLRKMIEQVNQPTPTAKPQFIRDSKSILIPTKKGLVGAKTPMQERYLQAIRDNDIVFGIGPAGTGKTYLAMAMALFSLKKKEVDRIILTRPAVEAGESLGFLPGDLQEKIDPYLRPLYDALHDMMPIDRIPRSLQSGMIEVAPLAFMRGRTLNDSFIVLDEAQNTTLTQMKMFLTRLGYNSKAVITGDITQIDLEYKQRSGLLQIQGVLMQIPGISYIHFTDADVVRHSLVQKIIHAFGEYEAALDTNENESPIH
ncbi:MAG: hypothetical protein B6244_03560 [Candidatus Cloacimonetes bacterium 4572_55]|nr:MAG: hypothetical protein B6244_03560 [Candidatus Cloacimonetes bacterium 4572_55]